MQQLEWSVVVYKKEQDPFTSDPVLWINHG